MASEPKNRERVSIRLSQLNTTILKMITDRISPNDTRVLKRLHASSSQFETRARNYLQVESGELSVGNLLLQHVITQGLLKMASDRSLLADALHKVTPTPTQATRLHETNLELMLDADEYFNALEVLCTLQAEANQLIALSESEGARLERKAYQDARNRTYSQIRRVIKWGRDSVSDEELEEALEAVENIPTNPEDKAKEVFISDRLRHIMDDITEIRDLLKLKPDQN